MRNSKKGIDSRKIFLNCDNFLILKSRLPLNHNMKSVNKIVKDNEIVRLFDLTDMTRNPGLSKNCEKKNCNYEFSEWFAVSSRT